MRITLHTDSGSYPLAGEWPLPEREFSGAVDFRISARHIAEPNPRVRASHMQFFHRGNLTTTISFSARRVFATHAEALTFAADLDAETERAGTVMLSTGAGARHLQDAVVDPPTHEVDGCAVRLAYVATGTAVERILPAVSISSAPGGGLIASPGGGGTMPEEVEDARQDGVIHRTVLDSLGKWFEVGFPSPTNALLGNATIGWTDPGGHLLFRFSRSEDLQAWDYRLIPCPTGIDDEGDDVWLYWARAEVPLYWQTTLRDFRISSDRYGKSITAIYHYTGNIALSGYPYSMPADKERLQADLRTAGYTGALVTSSSVALIARVKNHISSGTYGLQVTMSGTNVTAVNFYGSGTISLPGYPYGMPGDRASLQTDLRANGVTGAVVMLYQDPWEIFLPDRSISGGTFQFSLTIDPDDPFPNYDFSGTYVGEAPATFIQGSPENVRTPAGDPLEEATKQFFRLEVSAGPNNRY